MSTLLRRHAMMGGSQLGFDPSLKGSSAALDNGNFDLYTSSGGVNRWALSVAQKNTGKWRQQFLVVAHSNTEGVGIATGTSLGTYAGGNSNAACLFGNYGSDVRQYYNGAYTAYSAAYATNDRIDVIVDIDAGKVWWAKNGTVISGDPAAGTGAMRTFTGGTAIRLVGDTTGAGGRIRLLTSSAFSGGGVSGFTDGWPN